MKYRFYCSVCIFLIICSFFGCKPNPPASPPTVELSVVQIYDIIKNYDYWYYSFDGSVKAFKENEEISLQGEKRICDIQFVDGWIYYVKAYDDYSGGFDICRVRPNGEDSSVFFNSAEFEDTEHTFASFNRFEFVDGYMYIQASLVLYQYDMLTKTVNQIDGDISTYHIIDNRLYFIGHARKDFTIYIKNLETEETEILLGDGVYGHDKGYPKLYYRDFLFIGDTMYYTKGIERSADDYFVELFRYENGESTLIDSTDNYREFSIFEHDGRLGYMVWKDEAYRLMQYNPDDGQKTETATCNDYKSGAKIKNGYFYYLNSEDNVQQVRI